MQKKRYTDTVKTRCFRGNQVVRDLIGWNSGVQKVLTDPVLSTGVFMVPVYVNHVAKKVKSGGEKG
jgi:hypothetical protein